MLGGIERLVWLYALFHFFAERCLEEAALFSPFICSTRIFGGASSVWRLWLWEFSHSSLAGCFGNMQVICGRGDFVFYDYVRYAA